MKFFDIFRRNKINSKKDFLVSEDRERIDKISDEKILYKEKIKELDNQITQIQDSTKTLVPKFAPLHHNLRQKYRWYYYWHTNPYSKVTHWLIFLLFILSLPLIFFNFPRPMPLTTQAAGSSFPQWKWQNPIPTGNGLNAVDDYQNNTWVVGDYGTISSYNGSNWEQH